MAEEKIQFYICVPVYKVEKYIDACIQSVLEQTYQNFELILVDDGSPDRCGEICDQYATQDDRIHVVHQSNMGLIAARQTALRFVQQMTTYVPGSDPYIVTLDSDDSLKCNALQVVYDQITKTGADLVIFRCDRVANGKTVEKNLPRQAYEGMVTEKKDLYRIVLDGQHNYNALWQKCGKLSLYTGIDYSRFYHVKYYEDLLQTLDILKKCKKAVFIKDALYNYTVNPQSITQKENKTTAHNNYFDFSTVYSEVLKFIDAEESLTQEDYKKYAQACHRILLRHIRRNATLPIPYQEKADFFNMMLDDPFCTQLLNEAKPYEIILKFLQFRRFRLVILLSNAGYAVLQTWKRLKRRFR